MDWETLKSGGKRDLFAGVAFVLPLVLLGLTVYGMGAVVYGALAWLDGVLGIVGVEGVAAKGLAMMTTFVVVPLTFVAIGAVLRHRFGERFADTVDSLVEQIPGIGPIYEEFRRSRQLFAGDGPGAFKEVVSLELTPGVDILAFVMGRQSGADWSGDGDRVTVYVPMSPNPTVGGHLLAVRPERVTTTGLSVSGALAVLMTVGTTDPDGAEPPISGLYGEDTTDEVDARQSDEAQTQ